MNIGAKPSKYQANQLKISSNECIRLSWGIYLSASYKNSSI